VWLLGVGALLAVACTSDVIVVGGGSGGGGGAGSGASAGQGGTDPWTVCVRNDDCIVVTESCCGSCGAPTRDDGMAINADFRDERWTTQCMGRSCPPCIDPRDPTLIATCEAGTCTLVDLNEHSSTACTANSDCRLRTNDCCECGGGSGGESLIAINVNAEAGYAGLVCDDAGCDKCLPAYPAEATAVCDPAGYCDVVWAPAPP
jgi:hypothetical protein